MSTSLSEIRKMGNKPIKTTYKGILRVSNITDLIENAPDEYLSSVYYGTHDINTEWKPIGDQSTSAAFNGSIARFNEDISGKRGLKLPVTDSRGYFLNLFLGENDATIGIDSKISQLNTNSSEIYFPIVTVDTLTIGKEPLKLLKNKNVLNDNIILHIESSTNNPAKLIIYSKNSHNDGHIATPANIKYKTVFIDSPNMEVKPFDAFIYNQEYRDEYTDSNGVKNIISYVRLKNIREYIERRLKSYLELNTQQVPTGTVMWHFSTLSNWYCSSNGNTVDDYQNFAGYRPALSSTNASQYGNYNTLQGASKGNSVLEWSNSEVLSEVVCEYKKDYVLCDGKSYGISLIPTLPSTKKDTYYLSLDRFLDLFHCIGYYYTDNKNNSYLSPLSSGHYNTVLSNGKPAFKKVTNLSGLQQGNFVPSATTTADGKPSFYLEKIGHNISHDTLYAITMATIMAFKAIDKALNDPVKADLLKVNGIYNKAKAYNWLKTQKFVDVDGRYIFESYCNSTATYTYKNKTIKIGRPIEKFNDTIDYYIGGASASNTTKTTCKIYDLPEVDLILSIFEYPESIWASEFNNFFTYRFCVPKLYTTDDTTINQYHKTDGVPDPFGLFIGSNGLTTATSIKDNKLNITIDPNKSSFTQSSVCYFNNGYYPHAHAVTNGRTFNTYNGLFGSNTKFDTASAPTSTSYIRNDGYNNSSFNYTDDHVSYSNIKAENYFFTNVKAAKLTHVYNSFNGIAGQEYRYGSYKWYGRTSGPVDISFTMSDTNSNKYTASDQHYFRPESMRMLPLIKL
jgi:hypothetical protein